MATVYFYEKPGCINNTWQKKLLTAAGHQVVALNLLTEPWQKDRLRAFFGELAVRDWFNVSAPAIKLGEIEPDKLSEQEALALDAGKSAVNPSSLNAGRQQLDGGIRSAGGGRLDRLERNRDGRGYKSGYGKLPSPACTNKLRS